MLVERMAVCWFSSMFVNEIIIKVAAEICMRGMEVWTQGLRSSNHGKAGNF